MKNSQKLSESISRLIKKDEHYEISVYNDDLTTENIINGTVKLKKSFPALTGDFFDVLSDRIKDNKFTDKRLNDSINNVVDNCIYPTPTIAQFISFDKRIELYSYEEMLELNNQTQTAFKTYKSVKIAGISRPMYANINDIEMYNLEPFKK